MSEIKSKKALEYVEKEFTSEYNDIEHYLAYYGEDGILLEKGRIGRCRRYADKAVQIAETELTELHQQQLQELKDRAAEVHKAVCINTKCKSNTTFDKGFGNNKCSGDCAYVKLFTKKLTEKQ